MIKTVSEIIREDESTYLMLVDIGVWAFRDIIKKYPNRAKNIGIFETGMISVAAGMSMTGLNPIIYGITPFIVEKGLEQLKLDFCYQEVSGNFITTGASYDFSTLGPSHHCPEDIEILKSIPNIQIVTPGTAKEFNSLFREAYNNGKTTYYRLSDYSNIYECHVEFGKANVIKQGSKATVIAVSTMLDIVMEACKNEDVTILYYSTLEPFDYTTLRKNLHSGKILVCEPFYEGTLTREVVKATEGCFTKIKSIGIFREFIKSFGTKKEIDNKLGFTKENIKVALNTL